MAQPKRDGMLQGKKYIFICSLSTLLESLFKTFERDGILIVESIDNGERSMEFGRIIHRLPKFFPKDFETIRFPQGI